LTRKPPVSSEGHHDQAVGAKAGGRVAAQPPKGKPLRVGAGQRDAEVGLG